jgi:hypothetical protein
MKIKILGASLIAMSFASACGKKSDSDDKSKDDGISKPAGMLEAYSSIQENVDKLVITSYDSGTSLAEEEWDAAGWEDTARFNCFDECENGSITSSQYVADALDKEKSGPMGAVNESMSTICMVGALYADKLDEDGLPTIGEESLSITEAVKDSLVADCGFDAGELDGAEDIELSAVVTEDESEAYDRKIIFTNSGEEFPIYFKNSDDIVAMAQISKSGTADDGQVTRSIFSIDLVNKIFRMEYYNRTFPDNKTPIASAGSYSFYRGVYDETAAEVRFLSNMGSSNYLLNNTFLALSANDGEIETGAYVARTADNTTTLDGAFVCFEKDEGSFVNSSGCTENETYDRKEVWSADSSLWKKVTAKGFADFGDEPVAIVDFDLTTMFTLEPNY